MSTIEFTKKFTDLKSPLNAFAYNLTKNKEDAKDLYQETTFRSLTYKNKFQPGTNFKVWVFTIMKNLFLIVVMTFSGMIAQNDKFVFPENQQSDLNNQQLVFEVAGTPKELFERPNTTFVGYFIGSPAMNLFESELSSSNSLKINDTIVKTSTDLSSLKSKSLKLGIRSEFIKIAENQKENILNVEVEKVEDLGNYKLLTAKMGNLTIKSKINRETEVPSSNVKLYIPAEKCCVYENEKLI
mgnify:CR=1 FL=1